MAEKAIHSHVEGFCGSAVGTSCFCDCVCGVGSTLEQVKFNGKLFFLSRGKTHSAAPIKYKRWKISSLMPHENAIGTS